MLLYPAIDELKTKVDSKYTLAILASKRARDMIDGKPGLIDTGDEKEKPLSIATGEISEDLITYTRAEAPAAEEESTEAPAEGSAEETPAEEAAAEAPAEDPAEGPAAELPVE